jgi:hypothetical protein
VPTRAPSKPKPTAADPRFDAVVASFTGKAGVTLMGSKSGALRSLMLNGKAFSMSTHGRFVLKLDEARAAALVANGTGIPFGHGAGRPMGGWIEITTPRANWAALTAEAHGLALAAHASKPKAKPRPRPARSR